MPHEGSEDAVSSRMPTRHQSVSPGARYLETEGGTQTPDLPSVLETSESNALFKEATESSLKTSQLTHDQKKKNQVSIASEIQKEAIHLTSRVSAKRSYTWIFSMLTLSPDISIEAT